MYYTILYYNNFSTHNLHIIIKDIAHVFNKLLQCKPVFSQTQIIYGPYIFSKKVRGPNFKFPLFYLYTKN